MQLFGVLIQKPEQNWVLPFEELLMVGQVLLQCKAKQEAAAAAAAAAAESLFFQVFGERVY